MSIYPLTWEMIRKKVVGAIRYGDVDHLRRLFRTLLTSHDLLVEQVQHFVVILGPEGFQTREHQRDSHNCHCSSETDEPKMPTVSEY